MSTAELARVDDRVELSTLEWSDDLIDRLLAEQRRLTAAERFAQKHSDADAPVQARYYRDLIPIRPPSSGEQYAFEVDLDACSGCKACVTACHSLNGLAEDESWRDIGVLFGGTETDPVRRTVTTACHHCLDPACANGCPVLAYEKDSATGIVRHLDDQCIGCKYCQLKCPYDVPKYNPARGIVRKCDMCFDRLAANEAPACVQACPNQAISIRVISKDYAVRRAEGSAAMVPGAYSSAYTVPATTFRSNLNLFAAEPADARAIEPGESHFPLALMLVLTQAAAGAAAAHALGTSSVGAWLPNLAVMLCAIGLGASVFHLGQPFKAWRSFLGWRKSWLSREVIALGAFFGLAACSAAASAAAPLSPLVGWLAGATAAAGICGVFTSAMVYIDTRRSFWNAWNTGLRFAGTVAVLSVSLLAARQMQAGGFIAAAAVISLKLAAELMPLRAADDGAWTPRKRAALVQIRPLRRLLIMRLASAGAGIGLLAVATTSDSALTAAAGWLALLGGEILERRIFFRAVEPQKMPGVFKP